MTTTPWAIARYRAIQLSRGWWSLVVDGSAEELQVRIRDDAGLLFACRPAHVGAVNLFIGQSTLADVDLLVSPWPGEVSFSRLAFTRLTAGEVTKFLGRRVTQAMREDRSFSRLSSAARSMMSGGSFASRAASAPDAREQVRVPVQTPAAAPRSARLVRANGLTYVADALDQFDVRALDVVAGLFARQPDVKAVYGDVITGGRLVPTTQWDDVRARWFPLAQAPIFFRGDITDLDPRKAWERVQDIVQTHGEAAVTRIPLPLAVRHAEPDRRPLPGIPGPTRANWPAVSVIIPTRQRIDLLAKCLESLRTRTGYPDLEIVVIDNGADGALLGELLKAEGVYHRIVCVYDGGDFNFSRLINGGVRASQGEVLLLLNDDVMAMEPGWLHRMVDSTFDPSVGAVGARLVYSSGDIQHAGVMLGLGGISGHLWRHQSAEQAACNPHIVYPGRRMAVTGACLAVRRDAFDKVGGLDEVHFPVTLNDIDFCLRLDKAGMRTVYRGDAVLIHDESQSRGSDADQRRKRERRRSETRAFCRMWGHALDGDPFGSPAFDVATETGAVHIPRPRLAR